MRLNTANICADALIGVLSGTDALIDRQEKIAASAESADRAIGEWVRGFEKSGGVDALMLNTNYHVSYIPCRTWDTSWRKLDGTRVTAESLEAIPHWSSRFVRAHEMGIEPYALALKHARESGLQCWFSVRMNEFHDLRWPETSATLWLEHPEYRQAADLPFDYRHEEVRRYYVDYIAELCRDYDIDGIELDMIRRFEPNADDSLRAAVTECVRAVSRVVDEISREKGKRILVSARVYGLPEAARDHACEADLWAREGLVDGLTLSNFHTPCDYNLPFERWRRLIGPSETFMQAGCDFGNFGIMWNDIRTRVLRQDTASLRGFADAALNRGADGVYMFNLNTPDVLDFSALSSREKILSGERRYILTKHDPGADYELPVSLDGAWHERALNAGSGGENAVVRVGVDAVPESLEVRVNGETARFIGRMQPENGRGYVEGVVWNDYARRIVDTLPEAAAYVAEFALPNVAAGAARVALRGLGGEGTGLEIAVGAR